MRSLRGRRYRTPEVFWTRSSLCSRESLIPHHRPMSSIPNCSGVLASLHTHQGYLIIRCRFEPKVWKGRDIVLSAREFVLQKCVSRFSSLCWLSGLWEEKDSLTYRFNVSDAATIPSPQKFYSVKIFGVKDNVCKNLGLWDANER